MFLLQEEEPFQGRLLFRTEDKTCNNCGKVGHISPVCKSGKHSMPGRQKPINNLGECEDEEQILDIETLNALFSFQINFIKPFEFNLCVNNVPIIFQKDSGSPISAISATDVNGIYCIN